MHGALLPSPEGSPGKLRTPAIPFGWSLPVRIYQSSARMVVSLALVMMGFLTGNHLRSEGSATAEQPRKILIHYMPWFEAKPLRPHWGWHWTMGKMKPDQEKNGIREIASHYHPLIGPYDSSDPDVLEYHTLLMRLAGIDGVIVDWYGLSQHLDYESNHKNTLALVEKITRAQLQFAICYEDQTIPKLVSAGVISKTDRVSHARKELAWLSRNWFQSPSYLKWDKRPILLSFGTDGLDDKEWHATLVGQPDRPAYLSEHDRRTAAMGAFDWPIPQIGFPAQEAFATKAGNWPLSFSVAYPRFHDFYENAGIHKSFGTIRDNDGKVFEKTLDQGLRGSSRIMQICTWNDWGEGTQIEPSIEWGYRDLIAIQKARKQQIEPGFTPDPTDLELPLRLYKCRQKRTNSTTELDAIALLLAQRKTREARIKLEMIEKP